MNLLEKWSRQRARNLTILPFCLAVGCANPGPLHPPSLRLPQTVSDLSAERRGNEVRLRWTTPGTNTDGLKNRGALKAELCRSIPPGACTLIQRLPANEGPSEALDLLPSSLGTEPQRLVGYQVTIRNAEERTAGPSPPVFVAGGSAPPTVSGLLARDTEQGALLQWVPEDAGDTIEVKRIRTGAAAALARSSRKRPGIAATEPPVELRLRVAPAGLDKAPFRHDAGGTLDTAARRGDTYAYAVERVREVVLNGHTLQIHSALSPSITISMRDVFPPRSPDGLESIAVVQDGASPSIDLSWKPNTDIDLAGYLVYRQELDAGGIPHGSLERLTSASIESPGFRDVAALPGHIYRYVVKAVDTKGNESAPSAPVREELRLP